MEIFYSENLTDQTNQLTLSQKESRHLSKVLRKRSGDHIQITNGMGLLADAIVGGEKSKSVICNIQSVRMISPYPERNIHIALSTIRPNRMDWAVEKLSELGVGSISFFHSQFTSVKTFKANHLHKIAISAIKQSKQVYLPKINPPLPFSDWIELTKENDPILLLAHFNDSSEYISKLIINDQSTIVAIGPEGGFPEDELTLAIKNGFKLVKIDNHILRTETAVVVATTQLKRLIIK